MSHTTCYSISPVTVEVVTPDWNQNAVKNEETLLLFLECTMVEIEELAPSGI